MVIENGSEKAPTASRKDTRCRRKLVRAFRRSHSKLSAIRRHPIFLGGGSRSRSSPSALRLDRARGSPEREHFGQGAAVESGGDLAGDAVGGGAQGSGRAEG